MKRTVLSLFLSLALLTGCSSAAAPTAAPATPITLKPAVVTLAAPTQSKLVIQLIDCNNSIIIQEEQGSTLAFSGSSDRYQYAVNGPKGGVTTVRITQTYDPDLNGATLTVPLGAYGVIRVEGQDSGVSLRPQAADYEVDVKDCAFSANLPHTYTGMLSGSLVDCAASVKLNGQNPNLSLKFDLDDCSISAPDAWGYQNGRPLTFSRGTGGANLSLTLKNCAVSVEENALGFQSRYEGKSSGSSISYTYDSLELLTGDVFVWGGGGLNVTDQAKAASKPNGLTAIKNVPASGITALQVNANFCAVVLEPSKSGAFELAYQGVADVKNIAVSTEVKDGTLTVTAEGAKANELYLNASPDWRVNCVRLLVPEGVLQTLAIDCGVGIIAASRLSLPTVTGGTAKGLVSLNAETISAPIALSSDSGSLSVVANTISAPVALDTKNGSSGIKANSITGNVTLTAKNGSVEADVGTSTGKLALIAKNGSVDANVQSVKNADFQASNGSIDVTLGTITGDTLCAVTNGTMEVALTKKPANLTFHLEGGWKENRWNNWDEDWCEEWYDREERPSGLPAGWHDGLVLGNGVPTLTLSASTNGDISFSAP